MQQIIPEVQVVWMETGNDAAGLRHIVQRGHIDELNDYLGTNYTPEQTRDFIMDTLTTRTPVEHDWRPGPRGTRQYELIYDVPLPDGSTEQILIAVGDNGYVVSAYPYRP